MKHLPATLLALGLTLLASCASSSSSVDLVPQDLAAGHTHAGAVRVEATGQSGLMGGGIQGGALAEAVRTSVLTSELFEAVVQEGPCDWLLTCELSQLSDPEPSLDPEVEVKMRWRLTDPSGNRVLWEQVIESDGQADGDDALDYRERERIAGERAVAANLREGVRRLAELEL